MRLREPFKAHRALTQGHASNGNLRGAQASCCNCKNTALLPTIPYHAPYPCLQAPCMCSTCLPPVACFLSLCVCDLHGFACLQILSKCPWLTLDNPDVWAFLWARVSGHIHYHGKLARMGQGEQVPKSEVNQNAHSLQEHRAYRLCKGWVLLCAPKQCLPAQQWLLDSCMAGVSVVSDVQSSFAAPLTLLFPVARCHSELCTLMHAQCCMSVTFTNAMPVSFTYPCFLTRACSHA